MELVCPAGVILDDLNRKRNISTVRPRICFPCDKTMISSRISSTEKRTVVQSLNRSKLLLVFLHQCCKLVEKVPTSCAVRVETPRRLERGLRRLYGNIDILGCALSNLCEKFSVCWKVSDWMGVSSLNERAVNLLGLMMLGSSDNQIMLRSSQFLAHSLDFRFAGSVDELAVDEETSGEGGLAFVDSGVPFVCENGRHCGFLKEDQLRKEWVLYVQCLIR